MLVGVWNTLFGYGLFVGFDFVFERAFEHRSVAYLTASMLAQVLAVMNAFVFHKWFTFRSTATGLPLVAEFLRFSLTYTVAFMMNLLLLPALVEIVGVAPRVAAAAVIGAATVVSYIGHVKFSFRIDPGPENEIREYDSFD